MRRLRRPSPALIVATGALIVSLTGVAGALPGTNTVNSGDVVNNSLKGKDIKDNKITSRDLGPIRARTGNIATANDAGVGDNNLWAKATSTAECNPGEQIIGGYGDFTSSTLVFDAVATESTNIDLAANSVTVVGVADSGENEQFQATALCLKR